MPLDTLEDTLHALGYVLGHAHRILITRGNHFHYTNCIQTFPKKELFKVLLSKRQSPVSRGGKARTPTKQPHVAFKMAESVSMSVLAHVDDTLAIGVLLHVIFQQETNADC